MPNFSPPHNPVGLNEPSFMSNGGPGTGGTVTTTTWNTSIWGSPTQAGANVLSNCVGYAQGRMLDIYRDITGYNPAQTLTHPFIMFNVDAGNWKAVALANGFTVQDEPREGSVLVTPSHVAVVETFDSTLNKWMVSESGYDYLAYSYSDTIYKSGDTWYSTFASTPNIIGFILIPEVEPGPGPTPVARKGYDRRRRYRNI